MIAVLGNNNLVFTLSELVTISNPDFILVVKNLDKKKFSACLLGTDLSANPDRQNKFLVKVTASPNPLLAEILLEGKENKYWVYETADASGFNYTNINTTGLNEVEHGRIEYITDPTELEYYKTTVPAIKSYGN